MSATAAWACPSCYRIADVPAGLAGGLCAEGHDGVAMRRLGSLCPEAEADNCAPEPYVSDCERIGTCQYDRFCHFFHAACRFDSAGPGPLAS